MIKQNYFLPIQWSQFSLAITHFDVRFRHKDISRWQFFPFVYQKALLLKLRSFSMETVNGYIFVFIQNFSLINWNSILGEKSFSFIRLTYNIPKYCLLYFNIFRNRSKTDSIKEFESKSLAQVLHSIHLFRIVNGNSALFGIKLAASRPKWMWRWTHGDVCLHVRLRVLVCFIDIRPWAFSLYLFSTQSVLWFPYDLCGII